jgi:hypothetical protein
MEFSEFFELNRIAKSTHLNYRSHPNLKLSKSEITSTGKLPDHKLKYNLSSDGSFYSDFSSKSTEIYEPFKIEKDTSYLDDIKTSKRSSLTLSLLEPEEKLNKSPLKQLSIEIYFFRSPNKVKLIVPNEITVNDIIIKALLAYSKSNYSRLPHGTNSDGYEIWLPEDDGYLPDLDYLIDKKLYVANLSASSLCLCEKPDFRSSIYDINNGSRNLRKNIKSDTLHTKFVYENNYKIIAVNPDSTLSSLLITLWKKFFIFGDISADMFEFRIFIEEGGYECAVDMSLEIKDLPNTDIRLYRKVLADTPKSSDYNSCKSLAFIKNDVSVEH